MVLGTAVALCSACTEDFEGDFGGERFATTSGNYGTDSSSTGSSSTTADDDDGGGYDPIPDAGVYEEPGYDTTLTCQIEGKKKSLPDSPPFKTPGGLWDQNGWGACGYIALINANIRAGADDAGGKFEKKVRECLADKGVSDHDIADGLTNSEMNKIAACKEEVMASQGFPVDFESHRFTGWFSSDLKDVCEDVQEALDAGGSGVAAFTHNGGGHGLTIEGIECDEDTGDVTLEMSDPNHPHQGSYSVVIDCDDKVTSVTPMHFFLGPGAQLFRAQIEVPE